jgi:hypothetical protein
MTALIDNHERARRVARGIVSDVAIYNEQKITKSLVEDTFFTELSDIIEEAREHYRSRVTAELFNSTNYLECAFVDIILKQQGRRVPSKIW